MAIYIYGLHCPVAGAIRYIGKAAEPGKRFVAHLGSAAKGRTYCSRWLGKLVRDGLKPELVILRTVADGEDWAAAEREEIAKGFAAGWPLTNLTKGGEGAPLLPEVEAKRVAVLGSKATRAKMAKAARTRWDDPVSGERSRALNRRPEVRAKLSEGAKRRATPEYRAMMAEKTRAAWADREKRARLLGGWTDEAKASKAEKTREFWRTSPNAEKCRENLRWDEQHTRFALSRAREALATEEVKERRRARMQSPEYRAKQSAALKASWVRRKGT